MYLFKVILVGDASVGKSAILLRFIDNNFDITGGANSTIGVDFGSKEILIKKGVVELANMASVTEITDDVLIKLQVWDCAGHEYFRSITRSYYRNSSVVFLVYDISNRASFDSIMYWSKDVDRYNENCVKILVGNKADKDSKRKILYQEGLIRADQIGATFFMELSAKTGNNIEKCFRNASVILVQKIKEGLISPQESNGIRQIDVETIMLHQFNGQQNQKCSC